ncbi:MAG: Putative phosphatase [uncultured Thermomicrobiales bacterium]|uniref:Phosphatase n=1 Tax=uncultured Thermomicrobiales bacterium TaxID=1645740 RepID=A0A6J4VIE1_9BACT|nr:MAG: Putative phosphatase [uncultured Thermomicrobiales bacterium]
MASTGERKPYVTHYLEDDAVYSDAGKGERFADILARRISRRGALKAGAAGAAAATSLTGPRLRALGQDEPSFDPASLGFEPIALDAGDAVVVPPGYRAQPLLRWGDPITADAPDFALDGQTADAQARQFGYNCDWVAFLPLPDHTAASSDRGLLVVNHEYTNPELMFPGYLTPNPDYTAPASDDAPPDVPEFLTNPTQETVDIELEAHGLSVVEVRRGDDGAWAIVRDSEYNRRLTATTPMEISGPAAGADLMKTGEDESGTRVIGTLNNCAGGTTPWGTAVSGEENFQQYFANLGQLAEDDPVFASHDRFGIGPESSERRWEAFYPRFDVTQEPNEPFRFGWAVEFDPYDPTSTPKKRTALGRNKHEGHTSIVAPSGPVAIYSGDDSRFEYAYKFVTAGSFDPDNREANLDLLDEGTLYVARFNDDGTGEWLPLVQGEGELTEANGFASQADVLINTRFAADAVGATKMDRPEDFEANFVSGKVYLVCTNNSRRLLEDPDGADLAVNAANPRPENVHGHIIEITEDGNDHAATRFTWDPFILAGDPAQGSTYYAGFDTELVSPISAPDNITFDNAGNLWISTDGNALGANDGLFAAPTEGDERGWVRQFFSAVPGGEVSGPVFNPDNSALFLSVQHPGEGGSIDDPLSLWPDGEDGPGVPRPSVVVVTSETDPTAPIGAAPAVPASPVASPEA